MNRRLYNNIVETAIPLRLCFKMILGAAGVQGIETQEAFDTWFVQQRLNDPEYFIPRLLQRLEEIVGDGWLFERF